MSSTRSFKSGLLKVKAKVIQVKGQSRSLKVKIISWSRSTQGHSHFEVKVILESNCNVFRFYPKAGSWLLSECLSLLLIYSPKTLIPGPHYFEILVLKPEFSGGCHLQFSGTCPSKVCMSQDTVNHASLLASQWCQ